MRSESLLGTYGNSLGYRLLSPVRQVSLLVDQIGTRLPA
jgi:hypothetical protein